MAATSLTRKHAEDRAFWRDLVPSLSIEGVAPPAAAALPELPRLIDDLKREGYVQVADALSPEQLAPLRAGVLALHERKIPLPFLFVYDEPWRAFQSCASFLAASLGKGYKALPDFWVWHVAATDAAAGWGPHRDRVQPTVGRDNMPHTLTVWLPLTDATPLNGCIYALPAHLDPRFQQRVWDGDDNNIVHDPQNVRALPATAGSMLAWNQGLLHWGGRASRLASGPRLSVAFEFQRGDKDAFNQPLLAPDTIPPFARRLGLIGKQALQYRHMYPLTDDVADVAQALFDEHMR